MFSGIVEELGEIKRISRRSNTTLIEIKAKEIPRDSKIGDSVSVNGVCLTMVEKKNNLIAFEVMPETMRITNLGFFKVRDKVNLERSLKLGDRLSGHFVLGHIDCIGVIRRKRYLAGNLCFEIAAPAQFLKYVLPKCSVAVDGISLTVADKLPSSFSIYIIPHTLKNTTLGFKGPSDKVNVEFDILLKKP
ncbi:MAG: riboflavin synthase [Candidatus Omnitrophota bacterium]